MHGDWKLAYQVRLIAHTMFLLQSLLCVLEVSDVRTQHRLAVDGLQVHPTRKVCHGCRVLSERAQAARSGTGANANSLEPDKLR